MCGSNLADVGPAAAQEAHVRNCLEGGSGSSPQTARYLVYKLPEESALIGTECAYDLLEACNPTQISIPGVICLEEFTKGMPFDA